MTLSIRQRLTVAYGLAFAVLLGIAGVAIAAIHSRLGQSRLDQELGRLADTVASVLENEIDEGLTPAEAAEDALDEVRATGRGVIILHEDGHTLARRTTAGQPGTLDAAIRPAESLSTLASADGSWRVLVRANPPAPDGYTVVTLAPLAELEGDRAIVLRALTIILPLTLLLSADVGWWVAGRALGPAAGMAEEAHRITDRSTSARLTIGRHDELGRLALAFNALLDRLERAIESRREFLADASHELRTPVSVARCDRKSPRRCARRRFA